MNKDIEMTHPNSGAFILEQLEQLGSDVTRKHEVSFWLYFPSEQTARQAARRAETNGLKSEISQPLKASTDSKWLCLLYCPHVPDQSLLDGIVQYCRQLATEFKGIFDGWETSLELKEEQNPTSQSRCGPASSFVHNNTWR